MITKLNKIRHRIFKDFDWPDELDEFDQKNLIYGWNGTGKSTLCNIFRGIEQQDALDDGYAEIEHEGTVIHSDTFSENVGLPQVRVFDRTFIQDNVFTADGQTKPIFIIGKANIEKQQSLNALKEKISDLSKRLVLKTKEKSHNERSLNQLKTNGAREIKNTLRSAGTSNPYNNYDKRGYAGSALTIMTTNQQERQAKLLSEEELATLLEESRSEPKNDLVLMDISDRDFDELISSVNELCATEIITKSLKRLSEDTDLVEWVKSGVALTKKTDEKYCLFCEQPLPSNLLAELEGHFSEEFTAHFDAINVLTDRLKSRLKEVDNAAPPPSSAFYKQLLTKYEDCSSVFTLEKAKRIEAIEELLDNLSRKKAKPFSATTQSTIKPDNYYNTIVAFNSIIEDTNRITDQHSKYVEKIRVEIEESLIINNISEYERLYRLIEDHHNEIKDLTKQLKIAKENAIQLESEISDSLQPALELTRELTTYLGRSEITFEQSKTGYTITRHGEPAENLSEGERTAIAFLFFLKTLRSHRFELEKGIVVIDDPISSLDSNSIYCAFSYLREKTKDAGQLFVLTHNFTFFRQMKNWFNHIKKIKRNEVKIEPKRFYMLRCGINGGVRSSHLTNLDKLLQEFEAEYHYLFSLVHTTANSDPSGDLATYYHMPNIARRLLEAFLGFKYPKLGGNKVANQLQNLDYDPAKKARLDRFLNTYSHNGQIEETQHDLSILSETPAILEDLLTLIKHSDSIHYEQLVEVVQGAG